MFPPPKKKKRKKREENLTQDGPLVLKQDPSAQEVKENTIRTKHK